MVIRAVFPIYVANRSSQAKGRRFDPRLPLQTGLKLKKPLQKCGAFRLFVVTARIKSAYGSYWSAADTSHCLLLQR